MEITVLQDKEPISLKVSGRIDASNSGEFESRINEVMSKGIFNIIFDLSELTYISSAGLRVFMLIFNKCRETGKKIALVSPTDIVSEVFKISGLSEIIPSFTEMQKAVNYLT
jgi:anti-anti-sigma factor